VNTSEQHGPGDAALAPEDRRRQWWWLLQQHALDWHELVQDWPELLREPVLELVDQHVREIATYAGHPEPPQDLVEQWQTLRP
jgi:hypothetical protein